MRAPPFLFSPGFPDAHKTKPSKEKLSRVLKGEPDSDLLSPEIQPTIIGARAFHRPVRNGKGWGHSAMAVRQRLCFQSFLGLLKRILWEGMKSHGLLFHIHTFLSFCKLPFKTICCHLTKQHGYRIKPHGQLVPVSFTPHSASTPGLSTSWSRTTLQGGQASGKTNLQASFPLRCFQRLSLPHIATRQCDWRHNRYTRGASPPVLSY